MIIEYIVISFTNKNFIDIGEIISYIVYVSMYFNDDQKLNEASIKTNEADIKLNETDNKQITSYKNHMLSIAVFFGVMKGMFVLL